MSNKAIYIFVRADLKEEDHDIQLAHALFKMCVCFQPEYEDLRIIELDGGKVLDKVARKLRAHQIPHVEYSDSDKPDWGVTAICTVPLLADQISPLVNYRLRRCSPGVPLTTEALSSMTAGEPIAVVAQDRAPDSNQGVAG